MLSALHNDESPTMLTQFLNILIFSAPLDTKHTILVALKMVMLFPRDLYMYDRHRLPGLVLVLFRWL